jgi:hypothetical protein
LHRIHRRQTLEVRVVTQVIGLPGIGDRLAGIGDRLGPKWVSGFAGIRNEVRGRGLALSAGAD